MIASVLPSLPTAVVVGATLVALSTVGGVLVSRWSARQPAGSSVAVAVLLAAVVLGDLAPDIRRDLAEAGTPWWPAALAAAAGFVAVGVVVRRGCACVPRPGAGPDNTGAAEVAGGTATAVAIGVHRCLEGAALALVASPAAVVALVLHAAGEGFALDTLLTRASRARAAALLVVACVSPPVGAAATSAGRLPEAVAPVMAAAVAGALLRSALLALRVTAVRRRATRSALRSQPA